MPTRTFRRQIKRSSTARAVDAAEAEDAETGAVEVDVEAVTALTTVTV